MRKLNLASSLCHQAEESSLSNRATSGANEHGAEAAASDGNGHGHGHGHQIGNQPSDGLDAEHTRARSSRFQKLVGTLREAGACGIVTRPAPGPQRASKDAAELPAGANDLKMAAAPKISTPPSSPHLQSATIDPSTNVAFAPAQTGGQDDGATRREMAAIAAQIGGLQATYSALECGLETPPWPQQASLIPSSFSPASRSFIATLARQGSFVGQPGLVALARVLGRDIQIWTRTQDGTAWHTSAAACCSGGNEAAQAVDIALDAQHYCYFSLGDRIAALRDGVSANKVELVDSCSGGDCAFGAVALGVDYNGYRQSYQRHVAPLAATPMAAGSILQSPSSPAKVGPETEQSLPFADIRAHAVADLRAQTVQQIVADPQTYDWMIEAACVDEVGDLLVECEYSLQMADSQLAQRRYDNLFETLEAAFAKLDMCLTMTPTDDNSRYADVLARRRNIVARYAKACENCRQQTRYVDRATGASWESCLNKAQDTLGALRRAIASTLPPSTLQNPFYRSL